MNTLSTLLFHYRSMREKEFIIERIEEYALIASYIGEQHKKVLLHGELGAGKTTLTKYLVAYWGGDPDQVTSPTYTYTDRYPIDETQRLLHVDMYRMKTSEQARNLGVLEQIEYASHAVIERPKRTEEYIDKERCEVFIKKDGEKRSIRIQGV